MWGHRPRVVIKIMDTFHVSYYPQPSFYQDEQALLSLVTRIVPPNVKVPLMAPSPGLGWRTVVRRCEDNIVRRSYHLRPAGEMENYFNKLQINLV